MGKVRFIRKVVLIGAFVFATFTGIDSYANGVEIDVGTYYRSDASNEKMIVRPSWNEAIKER